MSILWMASYIALWLVVVGLAVIVTGLFRQLGLIQLRIGTDPGALITPEGLERGAEAPDFSAFDVRARHAVSLSDVRRGGYQLVLVFLSTTCSVCRDLVPHLNDIARERRDEMDVVVVCHGNADECAEFVRQTGLHPTLLADPTNTIATRYDATVVPFTFLIDPAGVILIRGVVNTWPQFEALLKEEGTGQNQPWKDVLAARDGQGGHNGHMDGDTARDGYASVAARD